MVQISTGGDMLTSKDVDVARPQGSYTADVAQHGELVRRPLRFVPVSLGSHGTQY